MDMPVLQAVYAAFARFRASHSLGASNLNHASSATQTEPATPDRHHVSTTAPSNAAGNATDGVESQEAGLTLRSIPSKQSGLPDLADAEPQQGAADRLVVLYSVTSLALTLQQSHSGNTSAVCSW